MADAQVHMLDAWRPRDSAALRCVQPRVAGLEYYVEHHAASQRLLILANLGHSSQQAAHTGGGARAHKEEVVQHTGQGILCAQHAARPGLGLQDVQPAARLGQDVCCQLQGPRTEKGMHSQQQSVPGQCLSQAPHAPTEPQPQRRQPQPQPQQQQQLFALGHLCSPAAQALREQLGRNGPPSIDAQAAQAVPGLEGQPSAAERAGQGAAAAMPAAELVSAPAELKRELEARPGAGESEEQGIASSRRASPAAQVGLGGVLQGWILRHEYSLMSVPTAMSCWGAHNWQPVAWVDPPKEQAPASGLSAAQQRAAVADMNAVSVAGMADVRAASAAEMDVAFATNKGAASVVDMDVFQGHAILYGRTVIGTPCVQVAGLRPCFLGTCTGVPHVLRWCASTSCAWGACGGVPCVLRWCACSGAPHVLGCALLHSMPLHSMPLHSMPLHSMPLHSMPWE